MELIIYTNGYVTVTIDYLAAIHRTATRKLKNHKYIGPFLSELIIYTSGYITIAIDSLAAVQ